MIIQYKNNIDELEKLVYHYYESLIKVFASFKYLITLIPITFGIYSVVKKHPIGYLIYCICLIPLSFLAAKKIQPISKKNACKDALKKMRRESEYFLSKKTLEVKDSCIIVNYNDNSLEFKLHNRVILDTIDDYVIIIDLNKGSHKYKLIIPNNAFRDEKEKETFIEIIKSKINK